MTDGDRAATQTRARLKKRRQALELFQRRLHVEGANCCVLYAGVPLLTDEHEPMRKSLSRTACTAVDAKKEAPDLPGLRS